jgi:hypothetical protein
LCRGQGSILLKHLRLSRDALGYDLQKTQLVLRNSYLTREHCERSQSPKSVIDKSPVGTGRAVSKQCHLKSVERSVPMQNSPCPVWIVLITFLPIVSMPLSTDVARVRCSDPESSVEPLLPKLRTLVDTRILVVLTDFQNTATTRQQ